jgi:hypothetical protein
MAGDRTSVYAMVHQVLADSKQKLASDQTKTASCASSSAASQKVSGRHSAFSKIADACERLSECIHLVNDDRSIQEKMAEYATLSKQAFDVGKDAPSEPSLSGYQDTGDKGDHQDQEADGSSQPPLHPELDDGSPNPGGPGTALLAVPATTSGESLDAGASGEATDAHQLPDEVTPNESPQEFDAPNALETNQDMMMPEQPEDVLKQAAAVRKSEIAQELRSLVLSKMAGVIDPDTDPARAGTLETALGRGRVHGILGALGGGALGSLAGAGIGALSHRARPGAAIGGGLGYGLGSLGGDIQGIVSGARHADKINKELDQRRKTASVFQKEKEAHMLLLKAVQSGVSPEAALSILGLRKQAEDALNPAQISAGTEPELQSAPSIPNQLSQGAEVGELTPRETAPNVGEGSGRELLDSIESAINATKEEAKRQNKGALSEILTEPAMSEAHDSTLNQSLDNTDSAGVKISSAQVSAARELLRRYVNQTPGNAMKVAAILKMSADGVDAADVAPGGGGSPMPTGGEMTTAPTEAEQSPMEEGGLGEVPEEGLGDVSEEAIMAAQQGVTPEELEQAQQLLAMQELAGGTEAEQPVEAPAAGTGDQEVTSQMGGMGTSAQPTPSPWSGGGM